MKPGDSKDENGLKRLIRICTPALRNGGKPVFPNKNVPSAQWSYGFLQVTVSAPHKVF